MQTLLLSKDRNGNVNFGIPFPDHFNLTNNFTAAIATVTEATLTIPDDSNLVLISASTGANLLVGVGNVELVVPNAGFNTANGHINPIMRSVKAGETLRVFNLDSATAYVQLTFYKE